MPIINIYDNTDKVKMCKDQEDPYVMYLIVRESLKMTPGKIASQVGHAVGIIDVHYMRYLYELESLYHKLHSIYLVNQHQSNNNPFSCLSVEEHEKLKKLESLVLSFNEWKSNYFRKIVLRADNKEWKKLKQQLDCYLVVDAGFTQIPSNSETVIALWPILKSQRPLLIKRLLLL